MSNVKSGKQNQKILVIGIAVIFVLLIARFVAIYLKSDGFSGLSVSFLMFALGMVVFGLSMSGCFAAWVYRDCIGRNDDGILWAIIVFFTTPFIGMLVYFLRRSDIKQSCPNCGHKISLKAKFCEECGGPIEKREEIVYMKKTHHLKFIVAGVISMVLMLGCLTGFIVSAATGGNINTSVSADQKIWNTGIITMSVETNIGDTWKLRFKSATRGYVKEVKKTVENAAEEKLYADIHCDTIPDGSALTLWLVQGEKTAHIDVTNLNEPLEYSLEGFEDGKIRIRLVIDGVEDVTSEICIK